MHCTAEAAANTGNALIAAWQAANGAAWCVRMSATITAATCENNRSISHRDLRCNGCGGLHNQKTPQPVRKKHALLRSVDAMIESAGNFVDDTPATGRPSSACDATSIDGLAALDEFIEELYEAPAENDDFDDIELELDDEQLLALFPELAAVEKTEPEPHRIERQEAAPRRLAYRGRCKRCGGYMDNIRERQDDNVFRCLACSWRTSPEYERNRAIYAAGGIL